MKTIRILMLCFAFLAVLLCGTGCMACSRASMKWTARKEQRFKNIRYELSPDKKEIVLTYDREKKWYIIPLAYFAIWRDVPPAVTSVRTFEKHISLDPMPDDLVKKYVDVTVDPAARKRRIPSFWTEMPYFGEYFLTEVYRPNNPFNDFRTYEDYLKVYPQNLYQVTVHPDELPALSEPWAQYGPCPLIPLDQDGDRYVCISPMKNGWYGVDFPPMEDYSGHDRKEYLIMKADFFDWCWKVTWAPVGLVVDVVLLPVSIPVYLLGRIADGAFGPHRKSVWQDMQFWDDIYR